MCSARFTKWTRMDTYHGGLVLCRVILLNRLHCRVFTCNSHEDVGRILAIRLGLGRVWRGHLEIIVYRSALEGPQSPVAVIGVRDAICIIVVVL